MPGITNDGTTDGYEKKILLFSPWEERRIIWLLQTFIVIKISKYEKQNANEISPRNIRI